MTKRFLVLFILLYLHISISFSQPNKYVDGNKIKDYITRIASDEFEGRETGTAGCIKTEEFFAEKFKELKLKPAGENNSYFHSYTIPFYKIDGDFSLSVSGRNFVFGSDEDFSAEKNSCGGNAEGKIVFAGYGIHAPDLGRDDYEKIDVKDKIVLIRKGAPTDRESELFKFASDSSKAYFCWKHGAKGILFFDGPASQSSPSLFSGKPFGSLSETDRITDFPVFKVDFKVVKCIFENAQISYKASQKLIDKKTVSFETNQNAKMTGKITYDPKRLTRNVLAMIPGTDSKLKAEAIIIGGHMDHLGKKYDGQIYNGADDNASGVAVTLGIAEAMIKHNIKPKRTIIFACWSGEEKGLLGSDAWVNNPTWDLNKVVVYFNLDMVGLGDGKLNMPGVYFAGDIWNFIKDNVDTALFNKVNPGKGGTGGSDHTPFLKKGIPAFAGMTSGDHPEYHQPEDDAEKINATILQTVGDFIYQSTNLLASNKGSFIKAGRDDEIKFRLLSLRNLALLNLDNYEASLKDKNMLFSLVDISDKINGPDAETNFISALKTIDDVFSKKYDKPGFKFLQNLLPGRERNKIMMMPVMNLAKIKYNELYTKALLSFNLKIGIIDPDFCNFGSVNDQISYLNNVAENGMLLMLNNMDSKDLLRLAVSAKKNLGIISNHSAVLTDSLADIIKDKKHLFIYKFKNDAAAKDIADLILTMRNKLADNLISLSPELLNDASYNKMKEVFIILKKSDTPEEFINRIFGGNFVELMVKAAKKETDARVRR